MPRRPDGLLRAFGMSGLQIITGIKRIEERFDLEILPHSSQATHKRSDEFEQFEAEIRAEASRMSEFYEVFYCLENSIRKLVGDIMVEEAGSDWWTGVRVDQDRIRKPAAARRKKEIDSGITARSENLIDYTTFGELSQLITDNWDLFDPIFQSKTAVSNVSNQLNLLRGPIAHCNPTDELEQERLDLAVRTWFKIMS